MDVVKPQKIDHKSLSRPVITTLRAILSRRQQSMESTRITMSMELRRLRSMTHSGRRLAGNVVLGL